MGLQNICSWQVQPGMSYQLIHDGHIGRTFGVEMARSHFANYLKRDVDNLPVYYDGQTKCFFIAADSLGDSHPPLLLDRLVNAPNLIIQQAYWTPQSAIELDRYVRQPSLGNMILFGYSVDGGGLTVKDAIAGNCSHIPGHDAPFAADTLVYPSTQITIRVSLIRTRSQLLPFIQLRQSGKTGK